MAWNTRDQSAVWHPNTIQENDSQNICIVRSEGVWLHDEQNRKYIDASGSGGTNLHGHNHPVINSVLKKQLENFAQIPYTGYTHQPSIELAESLLKILPSNQAKIFFSENRISSVRTAIELAMRYWINQNKSRKTFLIFEGSTYLQDIPTSYPGEEIREISFFEIPTPNQTNIESVLEQITVLHQQKNIAGFIFEPLILFGTTLEIYRSEYLEKTIQHCQEKGILCIADESFTGLGRTGAMLGSEHLEATPDIFCLSDNLTSGYLPIGVTSCSSKIFHTFLKKGVDSALKSLSRYSANPLSCVAALASLEIFKQENYIDEIVRIVFKHQAVLQYLKESKPILNPRQLGTILALDTRNRQDNYSINSVTKAILKKGVLVQSYKNTIYIAPPYCISNNELDQVYRAVIKTLSTS